MTSAATMLDAHPRPGQVDTNLLSDTIDALFEASRTARQCADACVHESAPMSECIGASYDVADLTAATAGVVIRLGDRTTVVAALEATREALRNCAEECRRHGSHLRHCATCAQVCERTEDLCVQMITALTRRTGSVPVVTPTNGTDVGNPFESDAGDPPPDPATAPDGPADDPMSPGATLDSGDTPAEPNEPG